MTANEELKKFCLKKGITISLTESAPEQDPDTLISIPGVTIKVSYKKDANTSRL